MSADGTVSPDAREHPRGPGVTAHDYGSELAQVETTIAAIQAALRGPGLGQADRGTFLYQLGLCEVFRFSLTGVQQHLDKGISDLEAAAAAIPREHPDRPMALATLASALGDRFERSDQPADLEAAFRAAQDAIDTAPAGHPARPACLATLGTALLAKYHRHLDPADLDAAISQLRAAAGAVGETGFGRAGILSNLGLALLAKFERTSSLAELDAAIGYQRVALADRPPDDPERAGILSSLGMSLVSRFRHTGALSDADDAIKALQAAVTFMPAGHPHHAGAYSNLTVVLLSRYLRTGDQADLDGAVAAGRIAVKSGLPTDPRWPGMAANAAFALYSRYVRTNAPADLAEAATMAQASVNATPPSHPDYAGHQTNLGMVLHAKFEHSGDIAGLEGAIRAAYAALETTPVGHVERANALANVGVTLRSRFRVTGLDSDRDAALGVLVAATEVMGAPPSIRARASIAAALLAEHAGDPALTARLFAQAVSLLGEVAPRQLARGDQQHAIAAFAGLSGAAASAALADPSRPEAERPAQALALLEASRGVLLSQALETRDDLTDLHSDHPDLAKRFVALRDRLDQPEPVNPLADDPLAMLGRQTAERQRLAQEFVQTLAEIRSIGDFATFGLPPSPDNLRAVAMDGPVVAFTAGARDGGALLLTNRGISYLNLPGLTNDTVAAQASAFHAALGAAYSDDAERAKDARRTLGQTLEWLWDVVAGPVLGALGYPNRPAAGQPWPRVWWVPGGKLGLLPVHAAGHHERQCTPGEPAASVLDAVVSSYTPTVRALRYARQQARRRDEPGRALIVAMPATPGEQALPGVAEEVKAVSGVLPSAVVLAVPEDGTRNTTPDNLPTKENVFRYLPACTIAHFACHADSDPVDPSRSRLLLYDHEASALTVAALAEVDHERLELTYLSACSTAFTAAAELVDEAIHLTSAFMLAGSRHVVGTLWPANDSVALGIAAEFYAGLKTEEGGIDTDRAAIALHQAVRAKREVYRRNPALWAPYLHAGA